MMSVGDDAEFSSLASTPFVCVYGCSRGQGKIVDQNNEGDGAGFYSSNGARRKTRETMVVSLSCRREMGAAWGID